MGVMAKGVHIVYASNDGYAGHLAASLYSLLAHNRNIKRLDVYVLSVSMCRDSQEALRGIASDFGRSLHIVELGDLRQRFDFDIDTRGFDISAMGRLFIAQALPAQICRCLYLDCDTIVMGSIGPLYRTDLADCPVGMAMEPTVYEEMRRSIGIGAREPYFNSGVLLLDLSVWRREGLLEQCLEFYKSHEGRLFACDQDTINGALRGRICALPPKYNFFTNYRYFRYNTLTGMCPAYGDFGVRAYREARKHPVIIHYMGDERPWVRGNRNHYRKYYAYYLSQTPWRDMPMQTGRELYMLCYWGMNHMTYVCPALRRWISRRFGMRVIDARKRAGKADRGE